MSDLPIRRPAVGAKVDAVDITLMAAGLTHDDLRVAGSQMAAVIHDYARGLAMRIDEALIGMLCRGQARTHKLCVIGRQGPLMWEHELMVAPNEIELGVSHTVYRVPVNTTP